MLTIGVDVSKSTLDLAVVAPTAKWSELRQAPVTQLSNTTASIMAWLSDLESASIYVVFEATGTYSDKLKHALLKREVAFSVVDTIQSKDTAQSLKIAHRNDQTAARVLAYMGNHLELPLYEAPSDHLVVRKQLLTTLSGLEKQYRMVDNQLRAHQQYATPHPLVISIFEQQLEDLQAHIQKVEAELKSLPDETFEAQKKLAMSVVGVGPKTAQWLLTLIGDIERFPSAKKLVSYCGLTNSSHRSGHSVDVKRGVSKQASAKLRACLYMGSISACKSNRACADLYQRLRKRGKSHFKAIVAVMAKLVKQLYGVLASGIPFDNEYYLKWK